MVGYSRSLGQDEYEILDSRSIGRTYDGDCNISSMSAFAIMWD